MSIVQGDPGGWVFGVVTGLLPRQGVLLPGMHAMCCCLFCMPGLRHEACAICCAHGCVLAGQSLQQPKGPVPRVVVHVAVVCGCLAHGCVGVNLCSCVWCVQTGSWRQVGGCALLLCSWWRLYTSSTGATLCGNAHRQVDLQGLAGARSAVSTASAATGGGCLQGRPLGTACVFVRAASGLCAA
jgi:hypothetical protein